MKPIKDIKKNESKSLRSIMGNTSRLLFSFFCNRFNSVFKRLCLSFIELAFLGPFSFLFYFLVILRKFLYQLGLIKKQKLSIPVISVGNLNLGGSGKTPIVEMLSQNFLETGKKVCVVARGYGVKNLKEIKKVNPHLLDASAIFGDEPTLLAKKGIPVFVGPKKSATCKWIEENDHFDLMIIDDGFQHLRLERDIDIVVIDALQFKENEKILPLGRNREPLSSLKRAHFIFVTKINLVPRKKVDLIKKCIGQYYKDEIYLFEYHLKNITTPDQKISKNINELKNKKVLLVSAIGNPESFEKLVRDQTLCELVDHIHYPDHSPFETHQYHEILDLSLKKNIDYILLTEKDAVKWKNMNTIWVATLEVKLQGDWKLLHETLCQKIF